MATPPKNKRHKFIQTSLRLSYNDNRYVEHIMFKLGTKHKSKAIRYVIKKVATEGFE